MRRLLLAPVGLVSLLTAQGTTSVTGAWRIVSRTYIASESTYNTLGAQRSQGLQQSGARARDAFSATRDVSLLEDRYAQLQIHKDTAEMRRLLDESFLEVDHHGNVLDKTRRLAGYASNNLEFQAIARDDVHVRSYGTTVVFTARSHATGLDNRITDPARKHFDVWHPLTHVWVKTKGSWRLVSEHNSDIDVRSGTRKVARIGMLGDHEYFGNPISAVDWAAAFRAGLRDAGYVEGQNVVLEFRNGDSDPAKLARAAAGLVAMNVDVIVASSTTAAQAAKAATHTIPIVFWSAEPITSGLVPNLDHPGANLTGLTANEEQQAQFLAVLKEVVPSLRKVAILFNPSYAPVPGLLQYAERGAHALGLATQLVEVKEPGDLPGAFAAMKREGSRAALVLNHGMFYRERAQLAALAIEDGIALSSPYVPNATAGALIAHEADFDQVWRMNASSVARILNGAKAGDLPVQRLAAMRYAVNLKTAKALGLVIPQSVLSGAALVIPDSPATRPVQDSAAILAVFAKTAEAYNHRDPEALVAAHADDADHIGVTGDWSAGRADLEKALRAYFAINPRTSAMTYAVVRLRFLGPDIALAIIRRQYRNEQRTRESISTSVLQKEDGRWLVTAFQNTFVEPRRQ